MEFKLNNYLWRHNELWQINRNHWLEIFRGGFWSQFFFQGGLCPPDFFSAYSTDQNEPLWRKKSAPLKKKKRPSEEKKAPPGKVSPLINLPLLLKNVTGTQCAGWMPNSLRNIYSQDIPKGRPRTFQQDVRGHSNRMSCNVLFFNFNLIFVPPMHIYEQWIGVRQLWLYNMLVITL